MGRITDLLRGVAARPADDDGGHSGPPHLKKRVVMAAGVAVAVSFIAPTALLLNASYAHADTAMDGYLSCVKSAGVPPRQNADDWSPTVHTIKWNLNNGESPAEVAQRLSAMGVQPHDAAAEVGCVMATVW